MKLGILSIYLVSPDNTGLLTLQLDYIAANTASNYRIYGVAVRTTDEVKSMLHQRHDVCVVDIPETSLRGAHEHSFYLDRLLDHALSDGCTHIAIFHLDSFPIAANWDSHIASRLNEKTVMAAAVREDVVDQKPFTAFMMFEEAFHRIHKPTFLPTKEEATSERYLSYRKAFPHTIESGCGYGYTIFCEGLDWYKLGWTNKSNNHVYFGVVHGNLVYHLGGATHKERSYPTGTPTIGKRIRRRIIHLFPPRYRSKTVSFVFRHAPFIAHAFPDVKHTQNAFERERNLLLTNPDAYLRRLLNKSVTVP